MTFSQTEHTITSKPLFFFNNNDFDIDTISINHTAYFMSKKYRRLFKRQKRKQQSPKTLRKVITSIFGKKNVNIYDKLKYRLRFSSLKRKKTQNGFHVIEGLYDTPTSNTNNLYKAPFMVSIKALYGYLLETNNTLMTSYPGIAISPYRLPKKQTFVGNALKDLILGFKVNIDFKL